MSHSHWLSGKALEFNCDEGDAFHVMSCAVLPRNVLKFSFWHSLSLCRKQTLQFSVREMLNKLLMWSSVYHQIQLIKANLLSLNYDTWWTVTGETQEWATFPPTRLARCHLKLQESLIFPDLVVMSDSAWVYLNSAVFRCIYTVA